MNNTLKIKRRKLGLTQLQFAKKIAVPIRSYMRYESEKGSSDYRTPNVLTAIKIADALGVRDLRELWRT